MENNRGANRIAFLKAVAYSDSDDTVDGSLAGNISLSGISLRVQKFIPIGALLKLQIPIGPLAKVIGIKGQVVRVRGSLSEDWYEIGLKFVDHDEDHIRAIGAFMVQDINQK